MALHKALDIVTQTPPVVDGMENRPDFHFTLRIKAKISEYAPNLTFQITLSFMVIRSENTPDFHLALRQ